MWQLGKQKLLGSYCTSLPATAGPSLGGTSFGLSKPCKTE